MIKMGSCLEQRYEVLELLGQGGMGTVYKVKHRQLNTCFALKELSQYGQPEQFQREAQLLASLQHPGLPRVIDYFSKQQHYYLVMDFVDGVDLEQWLTNQGQSVPEQQLRNWLQQLLTTLTYIHNQGVIHRDIKPSNVKLTPEGRIMLVDFGLAKQSSHQMTVWAIKKAFTPFMAAPEQMQGLSTDSRTDIYAVGATASYLLTQLLPPPLEVRSVNPQISESLAQCLRKALSALPGQRFQSASEMLQALGPAVAPAPLLTTGGFRRDIRKTRP